ncbi:hypothetical protein M885DRAFT_195742 [Pelagophyceae sp. CCMP2097]|nr:hypothetical protein M885DRAFT_195742 [Pelagophyceae sp. CCMP2097]
MAPQRAPCWDCLFGGPARWTLQRVPSQGAPSPGLPTGPRRGRLQSIPSQWSIYRGPLLKGPSRDRPFWPTRDRAGPYRTGVGPCKAVSDRRRTAQGRIGPASDGAGAVCRTAVGPSNAVESRTVQGAACSASKAYMYSPETADGAVETAPVGIPRPRRGPSARKAASGTFQRPSASKRTASFGRRLMRRLRLLAEETAYFDGLFSRKFDILEPVAA